GLLVADSRTRIEFANRAFREACGCEPEGRMLFELVAAAARQQIKASLEHFVSAGERSVQLKLQLATSTNALELSLERRDGSDRLYGRARIVTHHSALEAQESTVGTLLERKLRVLNDSDRFLIAVSELDSAKFLDVNRAFERIYGIRAQDALGKTAVELGLLSAEDQARHAALLHKEGTRELSALDLRAPDGRDLKLLMHTSKVGDCQPALCVSIATDVTDYIAAHERMQETDQRFRALFENMNDAMFFADPQGRFVDVNTAACKQLGYTHAELLQMSVRDIAPTPSKTMSQVLTAFEDTTQIRFESVHLSKDGTLVPVELTLCKIPYHGSFAVAGIARDLTEQRRIEAQIHEAHNRMQAILQTLPDLLFEIDEHGVIRDFHSSRTDLLTVPVAKFLGNKLYDFTTPEIASAIMRSVHEAIEQGLSTGTQYQVGSQRWFELSAARRSVTVGQPACAVALARDITERKEHEQELLRSNEELSRFTYTVSHDLKSPLVTIRSFAGMLRKDLVKGDAERVERDLHYIEKAASRMHQLLEDLLQLSRIGRKPSEPERLSLQELAREACELVAGQINQNGALIEVTPTPLWMIGERTRLLEVFQNIIDNAIKFAKPNEPARLEIGVEQGKPGEPPVVCMRDHGIGIDPRFKHRLFGLFEKLQPDASGTGIGLALIKRIIDVHGGRVWIDSEGIGAGTSLRFTLPSMTVEDGV
ncbi:MAG TPA: PAS domain S-box protein, partial [Polyangiales bacterium]|nr:PAS domain S-box protein [Polyangiales bacterium]